MRQNQRSSRQTKNLEFLDDLKDLNERAIVAFNSKIMDVHEKRKKERKQESCGKRS